MNSFILVSKNPVSQEEYLKEFIASHDISPFDVNTILEEGSVGIEIVRKLQEKLYLKPYKSKEKLIIVNRAESLTIEAQNALLKVLEEPPLDTYIFLCTTSEEVFLPTILSRCHIVVIDKAREEVTEEKKQISQDYLKTLIDGSVADKLALAEELAKDKENLKDWIATMLEVAHAQFLTQPTDTYYANILSTLQQMYTTLTTTNVNPRITLEHYFLTL